MQTKNTRVLELRGLSKYFIKPPTALCMLYISMVDPIAKMTTMEWSYAASRGKKRLRSSTILELLCNKDNNVSKGALSILCGYGSMAAQYIPSIIELATSRTDKDVRIKALQTLNEIGHGLAGYVDELVVFLEDDRITIRSETLKILKACGPAMAKHADCIVSLFEKEKELQLKLLVIALLSQIGKGALDKVPLQNYDDVLTLSSFSVRANAVASELLINMKSRIRHLGEENLVHALTWDTSMAFTFQVMNVMGKKGILTSAHTRYVMSKCVTDTDVDTLIVTLNACKPNVSILSLHFQRIQQWVEGSGTWINSMGQPLLSNPARIAFKMIERRCLHFRRSKIVAFISAVSFNLSDASADILVAMNEM